MNTVLVGRFGMVRKLPSNSAHSNHDMHTNMDSIGAGASVQILLFSVLAIELKRKAPNAHTFLEVVKIRYGPAGHITLALYCLVFQLSLSVNLLVGGSGIFANLTGMSSDAACFLFPLGVMIYTLFGGMKATFLTDWVCFTCVPHLNL